MKIGIDARLINETGVGRYIRNLVGELAVLDRENQYVIFLKKNSYDTFKLPNSHWQKRLADIPWHSFTEQILMAALFTAEKLDLVHIPYFNVPIFYPGKFIVTIHDLTILHFDTGRATTLPWFLYKIRRAGYYLALYLGLFRAQKILAVSEATKNEIVDHFHIDTNKIIVTYEGVDGSVINYKRSFDMTQDRQVTSKARLIKDPYFLYVGNAYPHKNLEMLLKAINLLNTQIKMVLIGERDYFYKKLTDLVKKSGIQEWIIFFGKVDDTQLRNLYTYAEALVFPSIMEGFGLPGLEAMATGTPVVCSDIAVFREIYGAAALYFNPDNEKDIALKLELILKDKKLRQKLIEDGKKRSKNYSWRAMAEKTLISYNETRL